MDTPRLLRPPVVWMVAAEIALVAALGLVTWHLWQGRQVPAGAGTVARAMAPPSTPPSPRPVRPATSSPSPPAPPLVAPAPASTPGIRTDPEFLIQQLGELNRVQAAFENLEWRATKSVVDGVQGYVEGVVLPAIERSERGQG